MFTSSVCSYPDRGPYGKSSYRGNCTGYIIKDFINTYLSRNDGLVADPSIGGGTSVDVAMELGVRFKGTDLHQGFNLLRDDFREYLQEDANLIWWHPPYANMIEYSGNQWGEADKWDMSRMSVTEFTEALELAVMNIHDACERGGHYGILMGNLRRQGQYFNLSSLVERIAPGQLVDEIIKIQHNCVSDSRQYRGRLVRINHEKLLVFRRPGANGSIHFLAVAQRRAENLVRTTWRAVVRKILQGKTLDLSSIYQAVEPIAQQRGNQHWQAKVRQVLQDDRYFQRVGTGIYSLAC
ncbi:DNA adenine modification methylase [Alcaligenes faecalis]|uniref:DNA adenine modification methylase n=1 Tax=Alcaligenes faecalis TaxID=511 RepID=UPI000F673599|nr:DNA adenine modification methylase [Alcaligenes faecalis]RSE57667.1 DNA adenine modification methylase [Alcaligenes faecalis]